MNVYGSDVITVNETVANALQTKLNEFGQWGNKVQGIALLGAVGETRTYRVTGVRDNTVNPQPVYTYTVAQFVVGSDPSNSWTLDDNLSQPQYASMELAGYAYLGHTGSREVYTAVFINP